MTTEIQIHKVSKDETILKAKDERYKRGIKYKK